jgi:spermidine dehydrogenase
MPITRRDFLNGAALTIAAGLTPLAQIAAQPSRYPPALMGLRGQHEGSFEAAHELARSRAPLKFERLATEENYDLVVIGGGISGLSAAWFYKRANPSARILILDNHDDFGGHAKRNEFTHDGRLIIGYGGSESIQSPRSLWSDDAKGLLRGLGVDVARFDTAFEQELYPSLGLTRGVFFNREAFGRDALVWGADALGRLDKQRPPPRPLPEVIADIPVSADGKAQLLALYEGARDPLAGKSDDEKRAILKRTSYRDFLVKICGCSEEVANCFQGRPLGFFGLGADAVPAADLRGFGYPGLAALGLPANSSPEWSEPYIYHFPDGNASIARLLVRALIPGVADGSGMDDVVLARFDYAALDRGGQGVRLRLDATCVDVRDDDRRVTVAYTRQRTLRRVAARHCILACFHMMIPHIARGLPAEQREALAQNVKTPLVYTSVLVRDWRPWINLKVHAISAPMSFHSAVKLDFPVSLGGYRHSRSPDQPIVLHLVHVPGAPHRGLDARTQFRVGQTGLLQMTFADFEERIRDDLDRMLGPGGFSSARDIAAITVNRWPHGYGYVANSLFDPDDYDQVQARARRPFGRIAIANSDAGGDAWAHYAIDAAARAVRELAG